MAGCNVRIGLAIVGLLTGLARPVWADRLEGPCQMHDGICYRTLDEQVSPQRHAQYMTSEPDGPPVWVEHDLVPGGTSGDPSRPASLGRRPVLDRSQQPDFVPRVLSLIARPWTDDFYRSQVKIEARFPQQPDGTVSMCSGTLIGSHTVLTAGHCVFSHEYGGWAVDMWLYPAMAGYHLTPYGEATAASLVSTDWWAVDHDHRGDIGIVRLNENAGDLTGWAQVVWGQAQPSGALESCGYPSEDVYDGQWLYVDSGDVQTVSDYLICHSMSTRKGMSGGPGWLDDQASARVTAVNSYCEQDGLCCMARYTDLTDQQRQNSETEAAGSAPEHWTCALNRYSSQDGCDCLCGVWDPDCDSADQPAAGCQADERCIRPGVCICAAQCDGAVCGPDGCGGVCGWCDPGTTCRNGLCDCEADCTGRSCGSDGCGGSCGDCPAGSSCDAGACACAPDCAGKQCGTDGCGGVCGQCQAGLGCVGGECTCVPDCGPSQCGPDGCGGDCGTCAGDQECVEGLCVCTYNCVDRDCGSDGCGGSCGTCDSTTVCQAGKCVAESSVGDSKGCGCSAAHRPGGGWVFALGWLGFGLGRRRRRRT